MPFNYQWDQLEVYVFSPYSLIRWVTNQPDSDPGGPSIVSSGVVSRPPVPAGGQAPSYTMIWNLLVQPYVMSLLCSCEESKDSQFWSSKATRQLSPKVSPLWALTWIRTGSLACLFSFKRSCQPYELKPLAWNLNLVFRNFIHLPCKCVICFLKDTGLF